MKTMRYHENKRGKSPFATIAYSKRVRLANRT